MERDHLSLTFGGGNVALFHELSKPFALYSWELGVPDIFLAADRLFATQRYEQALTVARLVFDPTVDFQTKRVCKA